MSNEILPGDTIEVDGDIYDVKSHISENNRCEGCAALEDGEWDNELCHRLPGCSIYTHEDGFMDLIFIKKP